MSIVSGQVPSSDEVLQIVIGVVVEDLGFTFTGVDGGTSFVEELGVDSFDLLEIVQALETRFRIQIETAKIPTLSTVGELADAVLSQLNVNAQCPRQGGV